MPRAKNMTPCELPFMNSSTSSGGNCIKIGLPGKWILGDYFQENMTSPRPFLLLRISFPVTYFYTIHPWYLWQLLVHGHAEHVDVGRHVVPRVLPHSVVVRDETAHVGHNVLGQSISSFIVRLSCRSHNTRQSLYRVTLHVVL